MGRSGVGFSTVGTAEELRIRGRPLTEPELATLVTAARRDGLIETAVRVKVAPVSLLRVCLHYIEQERPEPAARNRARPPPKPKPPPPRRVRHGRGPGGGRGLAPMLTREEAAAAVPRAREVGVKAAAVELGVSHACLAATWSRLGIKGPGHGYHARQHPGGHKLTREQAAAAAARAREIGRDRVAVELGVGQQTLWNTWRRWGIPGPGRAHASVLREQRRSEREQAG